MDARKTSLFEVVGRQYKRVCDVRRALARVGDVDARDPKGSGLTPLHVAVKSSLYNNFTNNREVVKFLLESGADPNAEDVALNTPLHMATSSGANLDVKIVKILLGAGSNVNANNKSNLTPLHLAVLNYEISDQNKIFNVVKLLINSGAIVDVIAEDGYAVLHRVAEMDHFSVDFLKLLLNARSDIDIKSYNGDTPLHIAAKNGCYTIFKLLLDAQADISVRNNDGDTPMHKAAESESKTILELIKASYKALYVNYQNNKGETALHKAACNNNYALVELLLSCGADVHVEDENGLTALHHSLRSGKGKNRLKTAQLLLDNGANISLERTSLV